MYLHQGLKIRGVVEIGGVNYPPIFWTQASPEQLAALGVSYVPDPIPPDALLFNWAENPDGSLAITPKSQAELDAQLALEKSYHIEQLNAACQAAIVGGFVSAALGVPHTYDSNIEDQLNLIGAKGAGIDMPYKCADTAGLKTERLHTAVQIQQVFFDGVRWKQTNLYKCSALKAAVQAATTSAQVDAVVWL